VDITGVPVVDTHVASVLLRTAEVVRLLGTELLLTGINPMVAQTLVQLDITLGHVVTCGDLESGIEYALSRQRGLGRAALDKPSA
jgi:rsbT co-antagonist protein RsbR